MTLSAHRRVGRTEGNIDNSRRRRGVGVVVLAAHLMLLFGGAACNIDERRSGVPAEAQSTIDMVTEAVAAGDYEKIYMEAADEWRRAATAGESRAALERVRTRLGRVESRALHTGREQQQRNDGGGDSSSGPVLIITYETKFERGTGMETFTLVERGGRWLLARYFVSSDALGP